MKIRHPPRTASILNRWVDDHARRVGEPPARVRNSVSYTILGGALQRAGFHGTGPKFTVKGGVALELRLRHLARATKDLDLILNSEEENLVEDLATALEQPYQGFSFRLKGDPEIMPNGAARLAIALSYSGKPWATVQVDVARNEGDGAQIEMVEAISLAPFGLAGPEAIPCISLPYHIAQKIHGMTLPPREGRRNERFRDLIDLLVLREWVTDLDSVQRACKDVFANRDTHSWPPLVDAPEHWIVPFNTMASELGLQTTDLHQAVVEIRSFIGSIDTEAPFATPVQLPPEITATTWYFAVGPDEAIHRIPARIGEALCEDRADPGEILPKWQKDPGGVALIGVVVFVLDRKPVFVERACATGIALSDDVDGQLVAFEKGIWTMLAREVLRQAKAPPRAVPALSVFLNQVQGQLPAMLTRRLGVTAREAHRYFTRFRGPQLLWDLWKSEPASRIAG